MRKKMLFAVMTVAVCVIVAAGGLLASNMGFKLNYRLNASAGSGGVGTGNNTLSLPYFRQSAQNSALDLMLDIGSGSLAPVLSVSKFNENSDTYLVYTGRMGATPAQNFSLTAGEGYFAKMASNVNYIVVGSHDPSLSISLDSVGVNGSNSGQNFFSPPYNITATKASQLMTDVGGGVITPVLSVAKFQAATDTYLVYTGRMGATPAQDFAIAPGEAYFVKMTSTVPYTPSHY